ncbi:MAG: hypothetical protein FD135_1966 [Comamonadaceae bacterium]|nr:MAG: hypothetical protein FD135_1966 [Comamonadaceae bacterium]
MKTLSRLLLLCFMCLLPAAFAQTMPPLNRNAWNIVFVQSFEASPTTNNLSAQGFNHALLFGQLLNTITAGKSADVRQIGSLASKSNPQDMTAIQSIEPYAVLNNRGVSHTVVNSGGITAYNSPAYIINNILSNQPHGNYIMAMPAAMINSTVAALSDPTAPVVSLTPGNTNQYLVLSVENARTAVTVYEDNIKPAAHYPDLNLKPTAHYACPQSPVTFTAAKPKTSKFQFNTGQTVLFVRHVEAHPNSAFENGNFVCQGEWRAIGANKILLDKIGGKVNNILTTNPGNLIGCDSNCAYVRPSLTISPFTIAHQQPLTLAGFQWNDAPTLAASLFTQNTPYSSQAFNQATTLVAWEHEHIQEAFQYLFNTLYQNPEAAQKIPQWSFTDYDTLWKLQTNDKGDITFSNSCEGIDSNALPSTCPAFPVGTK